MTSKGVNCSTLGDMPESLDGLCHLSQTLFILILSPLSHSHSCPLSLIHFCPSLSLIFVISPSFSFHRSLILVLSISPLANKFSNTQLKIFKQAVKLNPFYSEHLYTHVSDSTFFSSPCISGHH